MLSRWASVAAMLLVVQPFHAAQCASSRRQQSNGFCFDQRFGYTSSDERHSMHVVPPYHSTHVITFPKYLNCYAVGFRVRMKCKQSEMANFQIQMPDLIVIRRSGDLSAPGRVEIIVYCILKKRNNILLTYTVNFH